MGSGDKRDELFSLAEKIEVKSISGFTRFCLENAPDYFWTLPATTMKGHGHAHDELLVDHVISCASIAYEVGRRQFEGHWLVLQKDQLLSALILHDCWRCGMPGQELRITEDDIKRRGGSEDLIGKLKTSRHHPEVGYKMLFSLSCKYNQQAKHSLRMVREEYVDILRGVRLHYGPWTADDVGVKGKPVLGLRYDSVVAQVHNVDYHQSTNAAMQYRKDHP